MASGLQRAISWIDFTNKMIVLVCGHEIHHTDMVIEYGKIYKAGELITCRECTRTGGSGVPVRAELPRHPLEINDPKFTYFSTDGNELPSPPKPQSRIPDFLLSLEKMKEVHIKKNQDYASDDNPFSNFDASEYGLRMFHNPRDGAFAWPIFTKLARLSTLLNSGNEPNNESIEDSFIDIANYILLWKADYARRK